MPPFSAFSFEGVCVGCHKCPNLLTLVSQVRMSCDCRRGGAHHDKRVRKENWGIDLPIALAGSIDIILCWKYSTFQERGKDRSGV